MLVDVVVFIEIASFPISVYRVGPVLLVSALPMAQVSVRQRKEYRISVVDPKIITFGPIPDPTSRLLSAPPRFYDRLTR
jgi:hypothetical protein